MRMAIFGSSGMARAILDICDTMDCQEAVFIDRESGTDPISGLPIVAEKDVQGLADNGFLFSIGIGDNDIRKRISQKYTDLQFANVVHSSAMFGRGTRESLDRASGNIIMAGAIFSGNITFGNFGLHNFNCIFGHDVRFGNFVHLGPGAIVCGNVDVCDEAYIWTGSMIRNSNGEGERITIGEKATVGMGAVALGHVPPGQSVPPNRVFLGSGKP